MSSVQSIKDFVRTNKNTFKDGLDIPTVKKAYRKEYKFTPDRKDITDALIELRKDGVLRNDIEKLIMVFN